MLAVPVITWSTAAAFVLPLAGTPPGVRSECVQWVAVALKDEMSPETELGRLNLPGRFLSEHLTTLAGVMKP